MTGGPEWHPEWGPWGPPRAAGWKGTLKNAIGHALALGRSPAAPQRGIAILVYHGTTADCGHPWWVDFRAQMTLIEDLGYRVVHLGEVVESLGRGAAPALPTMAITFDDGWANNLEVAYPELARRRWPATVFLSTSLLARRPFLNPSEVRTLAEFGVEVGNHTHGHVDLARLGREAILAEIAECAARLADLTGRPPEHFCYPFGSVSRTARDVVAQSGVRSACSSRTGRNLPGEDPFLLRRVAVSPRDRARHLRARLAGGFDRLEGRHGTF